MKINLPFCTFKPCKFYNDGNCTEEKQYKECEFMRLKMKQLDELEEEVECEIEDAEEAEKKFDFIWGVKSWDDLSSSEANLYTMNDIDIVYDKEKNEYMLGVETAYLFDNRSSECEYLNSLLSQFSDFMKENHYDTEEPYMLWMRNPCTNMIAESIPELYTNFRVFVEGYKALYGEEREG